MQWPYCIAGLPPSKIPLTAAVPQAMIKEIILHVTGKSMSKRCEQNENMCTVFYS
jgi:hypothetical protein